MLCLQVGKCADLGYCQEEGAVLHVGEVEQDFGALDAMRVTFTDLGTGRTTSIDADVTGSALSIVLDGFFPIPGHVYRVQVTADKYGGGIFPVQVYPYEYDATGSAFDISTNAYDHLLVRFVKVNDTEGIQSNTEQWLSLPIS